MPLYEYACRTCSKRFEFLVLGSEKPACPKCRGRDLERLYSTFAVSGAERKSESDSFGGSDFGGGPDDGGDLGGEGGDDSMGAGACGTCGDPRGPGSCAMS